MEAMKGMVSNTFKADDPKREESKDDKEEQVHNGMIGSNKRGCTDIICLILWIASCVIYLVVSFMGLADGNPQKLISPRDYAGHYCGVKTNWNNGPDLEDFKYLSYTMNITKATDVIAKQLICSTFAKDYLQTVMTTTEYQSYLCDCCLTPCAKCVSSLNNGGDLTSLSGLQNTISGRMTDLTNPLAGANLFSPSGPNMDYFSKIWSQANEFFVEACMTTCNPAKSNSSGTTRAAIYKPSPDDPLNTAWKKLNSSSIAQATIQSSFTFQAYQKDICPYEDASVCVAFPGIEFADLVNGYCTMKMAADVIGAVGAGAASAFESLGLDSISNRAQEQIGVWAGDFNDSIDTLIVVGLCSLVVGVIFLVILRFTVRICVYLSILLIFMGFGMGGFLVFARSGQCSGDSLWSTGTGIIVQTGTTVVVAAQNAVSGNQVSEAMTGNGQDYRGVQTRSRSGYLCQKWDATFPHNNTATISSTIYPNAGLAGNNYCRNPVNASSANQASTIWCFTTDTSIEWELCTPIGVIQAVCTGGYKVPSQTSRDVLEYSAYVIWGLAFVWLLLVACLYRRIQLAIGLNEVAAQFLSQTPTILIIPAAQSLLGIVWIMCWGLSASFLLSQVPDNYTPTTAYESYAIAYGTEDVAGKCTGSWPTALVYKAMPGDCVASSLSSPAKCWYCSPPRYMFDWRFAVSFFCFLWNNNFLIAFGQCIVAGAVAFWFYTPNNQKGTHVPFKSLRVSNYNVWRFHTGSLAFGAFIIAVVQFIRALMYYLEKQAEQQKNKVMVIVFKVIQCCLYCFERFIKFLNKNAYIQIAIRGLNFCSAAKKAFFIITSNFIRFGTVAILGEVIQWIGYIFIMGFTTMIGYFILTAMHPDIGPFIPCVMYLFVGYVIGMLYMNVFGLSVDTCLQCFIFAEENGVSDNCIPKQLRTIMDNGARREGKNEPNDSKGKNEPNDSKDTE